MSARHLPRARGFTLIELIVAMTISAIVAGFISMLVLGPIDSFFAQSRRARLSDLAASVWQNLERDVRAALPNNVRTANAGNFVALEMLNVIDTGRYQADLALGTPDNAFSTAGNFSLAIVHPGPPYLAIVDGALPSANAAYGFGNVMTANGVSINTTNPGTVALGAPMTFISGSPRRRAYIVAGAVSYVCDTAAGTVTRYAGYTIGAVQPVAPAAFFGGNNSLIATNVASCAFSIVPGSADNGGVVSIRYTVTTPEGDLLTLQHDARIENPA